MLSNLDSILKSRYISLLTKVCLVKAMVFPVVMYGCESWTIKKAEHRRIDAFELWCWRRLLRVLWTARRSSQSILKEISCSLEGLMLKLKLHYFGHLMQRADSGKDPDAGKDWRHKEKGMTEYEMVRCHHQLLEFTKTHCPLSRWCHLPSHPLLSPSPPAFYLSQHQGLLKWVSSSHQVVKVLEFQLQNQSFQIIFRIDIL